MPSSSSPRKVTDTSAPSCGVSQPSPFWINFFSISPPPSVDTSTIFTSSTSYSTTAPPPTPRAASPSSPNAASGCSVTRHFSPTSIVRTAFHAPDGSALSPMVRRRAFSAWSPSKTAPPSPATRPVYRSSTSHVSFGLSNPEPAASSFFLIVLLPFETVNVLPTSRSWHALRWNSSIDIAPG